ncbi:radical SAM family heme chaperone HemW [Longispora albida]|uniref:radical SAM family heme chaperone HemW n=1 Tax=Longispora albida TaxID=203523 RepID=UPI00036C4CAD|nr:radical SAM family heme chaperone HemW [Longispora albida]
MPGALPSGEPVPADGPLSGVPPRKAGERGFGVYVHVPFCASRCGYCDFNTYTPSEGVTSAGYADQVLEELALASRAVDPPAVSTIFVGGGTPTLLPAAELGRIIAGIEKTWGFAPGAEITTEANPETVTPAYLAELRAAGFTRISLGMQSAAAHVLAVLDRRHTAGRAVAAAAEARAAGFEHVNLDLIYGTPGETAEDFERSLAAVLEAGVDHVSAYALIVEDGTRMAARMRRGELPYPDDDVAADRYLAATSTLEGAGLANYEVSNWALPGGECQHNLLYWRGGDWWGFGPGAHSHVAGVRWWNVKHPSAYASALAAGQFPAAGREVLGDEDRRIEEIMLRLRLAEGLPLSYLDDAGRTAASRAAEDGLLVLDGDRAVLTLRGRLLADAVIRDLT